MPLTRINKANHHFVLSAEPLPFLVIYWFFKDIPQECENAARVDGASELRIL